MRTHDLLFLLNSNHLIWFNEELNRNMKQNRGGARSIHNIIWKSSKKDNIKMDPKEMLCEVLRWGLVVCFC
jgi:hypothetical protein